MAGIKDNRRTIYTKRVIKESILKLLSNREIHEITVTDICKVADLNRGTFYTHYKDPFDLLQTMEDELFNSIIEYISIMPLNDGWEVLMVKVLELIRDNKELCLILICKQKDSRILNRIFEVAEKTNLDLYISRSTEFDEVFLKYYKRYCVSGTVSIVQAWLEDGLTEPPEKIVEVMNRFNKVHNYFNE